MLTQQKADELLNLEKHCISAPPIDFPMPGNMIELDIKSTDNREDFKIDVNRKGRIRLTKCTYQERYASVEILLRLDIDGPPHENPDGDVVPCPHLHVYKEGFGDRWAYPIPNTFTNTSDLVKTLREFLVYCKVRNVSLIQRTINS